MRFFLIAFLCLFNLSLMGQGRIAVIPFTGISASEGNLLANMIETELREVGGYAIAQRTTAINAAIKEQNIQRTGLTDADTIAKLGKGANARFVVSAHVQKLGDKNLISASIIDVETLQQISGDYVEYGVITEAVEYLPILAEALLSRINTDYRSLPTLAIIPFEVGSEESVSDRDVLAQILSIEIANSGRYAVVTRTTSLESVMKEQNIQREGLTDQATISKLGIAINADYVLLGDITKLEGIGYISANIINVEKIELEIGSYMDYKTLGDGIKIVPVLSFELTGVIANPKAAKIILDYLLEVHEGKSGIFTIKSLLDEGIDATDSDGWTALYRASVYGYTDIVKALIAAGADVNIKDNDGWTALIYASVYGYTDIARALINAGVDTSLRDTRSASIQTCVNIKDSDGSTALIMASSEGYTEIVRALIQAGADVNIKNNNGDTALSIASSEEHTEVVRLLKAATGTQ